VLTDLEPLADGGGKVVHERRGDTYELRSNEAALAAHFQLRHANACHVAEGGYFGSKFVTVVVTGGSISLT
jgi:nuclear protein localization protein 4 homolog